MEKIGLIFRKTLENRIQKELKESTAVFIIKYSKLSAPDFTLLRQSLSGLSAKLLVAKNSIVRRTLLGLKLKDLLASVDGPSGLVFAKKEPQDTSRALYNFSREHENLKLECGYLEDKFFDKKGIEMLANLAPKEVLRAQMVVTLKSPLFRIAFVLKETLRRFVYCLGEIKNKKGN